MRGKILLVLHQLRSSSGRIGMLLSKKGFILDVRRPPLGDSLPATMDGHCGAIIFGGPMSANDPDSSICREIDWIGVPLRDKKPFLGVCLGAQMLSLYLGGRVFGHARSRVEIGYYPIYPTSAAASDWPLFVYHWHKEGLSLPASCISLAHGETFEQQAFRYGDFSYGVQFHPEVTLSMMYRWITLAGYMLSLPGAKHREDHFRGRILYDRAVGAWLDRFLDDWLGVYN